MIYNDIEDIVDKMTEDEFKSLMSHILSVTENIIGREKLKVLLVDKVQKNNK